MRVDAHESCGYVSRCCGGLWTHWCAAGVESRLSRGRPQEDQARRSWGSGCEQVVPNPGGVCSSVIECEGNAVVPKSYPQLGRTWGRLRSLVVVGRLWQVGLDRPWLGLNPAREVGYLVEKTASFGHQLANLPVCVHDGGVIAAPECLANLG